jgi:hypothetical protein
MNEALTDLLFESLVAHVLTPERLIMEHAVLVAILHANVGTEVGEYLTLATVLSQTVCCYLMSCAGLVVRWKLVCDMISVRNRNKWLFFFFFL